MVLAIDVMLVKLMNSLTAEGASTGSVLELLQIIVVVSQKNPLRQLLPKWFLRIPESSKKYLTNIPHGELT